MESNLVTVENLPQILVQNIKETQSKKVYELSKKVVSSVKISNSGFLNFASQLPLIRHALKVEKGFTAIIPENLKKGLKDGTLKILQGKDGSLISEIVDSSGKIVHQLRLKEFTKLINPAELSQAMNQICMQMQLEEIQKTLTEFRLETNAKLDEILLKLHGNRVIPTDAVKLSFERYQKGEEITKGQLLSKIDDAKAALLKEIQEEIRALQNGNYASINQEKNIEIQTKIGFVLESINGLQDLYMIETFLAKADEKKRRNIAEQYTNKLLEVLTKESIRLLDSYSDFGFLGLKENVWENKLYPMAQTLLEQKENFERYKLPEAKK